MKIIFSILNIGLFLSFYSVNAQNDAKILFQNSPNFRGFEDVVNYEGKTLKDGLIYRSGSFSNLTEEEKEIFQNLNINTIVDLRSESEIKRDPDYIPENQEILIHYAPIGSVGDEKSMKNFMKVMSKPNFDSIAADSLMIAANKKFVDNLDLLKPFFESLKDEEAVVLFHCSAGKDRTGITASLFLHILDVPFDVIINNFMKSNEAIPYLDDKKLASYGVPIKNLKLLMGVKPTYLEAGWNGIIAKYGTIDNMLLQKFGLDDAAHQKIKAKYLK